MPANIENEDLWRANIYAVLGNLLAKPPAKDTLTQIASTPIEVNTDEPTLMQTAWESLIEAAKTNSTEQIKSEFHTLFIGITGGTLMPYASWYLTGFLMEKPLASIRADLVRLGFERRKSVSEPEDHVAALCEVMSLLIVENNVEQTVFFNKHMRPWIAKFFNDLAHADVAKFYRPVGIIGESLFQIEKEFLTSKQLGDC